ncbi:MAG: hypothetical protein NVS2B12_13920 [Ktedonobacteraceae bacterium]
MPSNMSGTGRLSLHYTLRQRYKIVALIGQGGMGAVYKAQDAQFGGRLIAVKEMRQSSLTPQEAAIAAEQFKQEANLLANLKHPNLPSIYDYFSEHGRWYLVMDFIEGMTLHARLNAAPGHVLPLAQTLDIGIQLAKVLGYLHSRPSPIIFRDLKPLNIMITPEDNIYLIDFGIARLFKPGQAQDTVAYVSQGYAAPEQFGQAQTSPQSDIYSLGATLHQLLSGNNPSTNVPPFTFKPLTTYNPNIPPTLATLISTMLNIDPDRRPASMADIRQELERIQTTLKQSPLPPTQYAPSPLPPVVQKQSPPPPPPPDAQDPGQIYQIYHNLPPQAPAKPALPKGRIWKALLIGALTGIALFSLITVLRDNSLTWLVITITSLLVAGFITGKTTVLRKMGFFMGCVAGITLFLAALIANPTTITEALTAFAVFTLIGGLLGLLGAWLATIGHPYYKKP